MSIGRLASFASAAFRTERRRLLWTLAVWLIALLSGNGLLTSLISLALLLRFRWEVFDLVTGPRFCRCTTLAFGTERRRFLWVFAAWLISLLSEDVLLAALIAMACLLRYFRYFVDFFKSAFRNEWPFNALSALIALTIYVLTGLSSVIANFLIPLLTGFHSSQFPGATTVLEMLALFFSAALAFTSASGLAALLTGFSSGIANRTAPVAFMLAVTGIVTIMPFLNKDQGFVDLVEEIVIKTSFSANGRFDNGWYAAADGKREYGAKVCRDLLYDTLLAPHSNTGYMTAVKRVAPARLAAPKYDAFDVRVLATKYVYGYIAQDKCPDINAYTESLRPPAKENSQKD